MTRAALAALLAAAAGVGARLHGQLSSRPTWENLMPVPAAVRPGAGVLIVDRGFRVALGGYGDLRVARAAERLVGRLARQSGIPIGKGVPGDRPVTLRVDVVGPGAGPVQQPVENESYRLVVTPEGATLTAPTPYGALRGMETFVQLVDAGPGEAFHAPAVTIEDEPRFPWRGLLMDVARHWLPPEVVRRNLDAMAAVKLNVLHWHLTEDQGFRVESRRFPALHERGSDGRYYTQDEIRGIVAYAADRGIRVVPEFDMPGHTRSWFVGRPDLASGSGPYEIGRTWGVHDPTLDPSREEVYAFIEAFLTEMTGLFPDPYLHIGGDEVNGREWDANPGIQAFKRAHELADNHALQAYFNRRLLDIVTRLDRRMVGWDEILHPDLPRDIVVQSWRGQESLAEGARRGYLGILSAGYYLDHIRSAAFHYGVDPHGGEAAGLSAEQRARILGGEACMWAEYVTAENVDSRIWPRTAAIAERLWSPAAVQDVDDMYRRLAITSRRLGWMGVTHRSSYPLMLERLAGHEPSEPLRTLADVLEPLRFYQRSGSRDYTSLVPLNRLVDAVRPESERARAFAQLVDTLLADRTTGPSVRRWLERWRDNHEALRPLLAERPLLTEVEPLSWNLRRVAEVGLVALDRLERGTPIPRADRAAAIELLDRAAEPQAEMLLVVVPAVRRLVEAASPPGD